jgi:hypothetical protein
MNCAARLVLTVASAAALAVLLVAPVEARPSAAALGLGGKWQVDDVYVDSFKGRAPS